MLDEAKELVSKAINYVLDQQFLGCDDSWPVPRGREYWKELYDRDVYGLLVAGLEAIVRELIMPL